MSDPIVEQLVEARVRYRKTFCVEAVQWFKLGDHPEVTATRPFNWPEEDFGWAKQKHGEGWIETLEGGYTVTPGDWIITGINGEFHPCKPDIFSRTYEPEINHDGEVENLVKALNNLLRQASLVDAWLAGLHCACPNFGDTLEKAQEVLMVALKAAESAMNPQQDSQSKP